MNFAFRVDSGRDIGLGHLMRCLTLAESFHNHGHKVVFICVSQESSFHFLAEAAGFEVLLLSCFDFDAKTSIDLLRKQNIDWLVIDHYEIDERWEKFMREGLSTTKIMVIDDVANRRHDCDVILDQNYYVDAISRYDDLVPKGCLRLLGPSYAILRPQFFEMRSKTKLRSGLPQRLFVFFGGSDALSMTKATLQALLKMKRHFEITVVLGANHPDESVVRELCHSQKSWKLFVQSSQIAELMAACDLAIGAGGSTSWERCCLGLPAIITALANNQIKLAEDLSAFGAALYVDPNKDQWERSLTVAIERFFKDPNLLNKMSTKAFEMMEKASADKVLDTITKQSQIELRPVSIEDAKLLFDWRNDEATRTNSIQQEAIPWDTHLKWLSNTLQSKESRLFIAILGRENVGTARISKVELGEELSWTVSPQHRGQGIGTVMVAKAAEYCSKRVFARILIRNIASQRIAVATGFHLISRDEDPQLWELRK